MKIVIKEICIALLVCVAIALIFAIMFYDYVPVNKVIPNKVAYTVPDEIKTELGDDIAAKETQPQKITYSVTSSDLKEYESATVYQPGNPNPFKAYTTGNTNTDTSGNGGSGSGSSGSGNYYYPTTNTHTK